jgi:hypothetical protein
MEVALSHFVTPEEEAILRDLRQAELDFEFSSSAWEGILLMSSCEEPDLMGWASEDAAVFADAWERASANHT